MPFFQIIDDSKVERISQTNFELEKRLQNLVEGNLSEFFSCQFVASEFSTGDEHAGRIDSLALSEDSNPVIIEYKKVESSSQVNQSLYYLSWLKDHKGDFELEVQKVLGNETKIDWSYIRVICIAPNYSKYDLHAVRMMGANIELWQYKLYENGSLYLDEVFNNNRALKAKEGPSLKLNTEASINGEVLTIDHHLSNKDEDIKYWFEELKEFILSLDDSIEEVIRKTYIAYRGSMNIACIEIKRKQITIYLRLLPEEVEPGTEIYRDVRSIGHNGTGEGELTVNKAEDLTIVKRYIEQVYKKLGG
jgi:predicted transport protein